MHLECGIQLKVLVAFYEVNFRIALWCLCCFDVGFSFGIDLSEFGIGYVSGIVVLHSNVDFS